MWSYNVKAAILDREMQGPSIAPMSYQLEVAGYDVLSISRLKKINTLDCPQAWSILKAASVVIIDASLLPKEDKIDVLESIQRFGCMILWYNVQNKVSMLGTSVVCDSLESAVAKAIGLIQNNDVTVAEQFSIINENGVPKLTKLPWKQGTEVTLNWLSAEPDPKMLTADNWERNKATIRLLGYILGVSEQHLILPSIWFNKGHKEVGCIVPRSSIIEPMQLFGKDWISKWRKAAISLGHTTVQMAGFEYVPGLNGKDGDELRVGVCQDGLGRNFLVSQKRLFGFCVSEDHVT